MRSGEGFNPLRSFQSQADERTRLPLGLGRHCRRRSFSRTGESPQMQRAREGWSVCLWLQRIRGALSCTASLQVCGERVFLRSLKESVNRSTAGAVLPRRGSLAAGVQRTGHGRGPEQSSDAAAHGGLQGAVVGWRVGTPVCAEPEALQAVPCGSFPATVTRRAWQESQPRHSALCVQFHTIASFFLTCLL